MTKSIILRYYEIIGVGLIFLWGKTYTKYFANYEDNMGDIRLIRQNIYINLYSSPIAKTARN